MLNQRKSWSQSEDQLLIEIYQNWRQKTKNQAINWNFVAKKVSQQGIGPNRSGKQCRQRQYINNHIVRWLNQLNPEINKNFEWNQQERNKLLSLHQRFGNHWSIIAKHFQGQTDSSIKNFMNSTLRRGLRLLNLYISKNRKFKQFRFRNVKEYKTQLLNKILTISGNKDCQASLEEDFSISTVQSNKQEKLVQVYRLASQLKKQLLHLQTTHNAKNINLTLRQAFFPINYFENIMTKVHYLNSICKKRKQSKPKKGKCYVSSLKSFNLTSNSSDFNFNSGNLGKEQKQIFSNQKFIFEKNQNFNSNNQQSIKIDVQNSDIVKDFLQINKENKPNCQNTNLCLSLRQFQLSDQKYNCNKNCQYESRKPVILKDKKTRQFEIKNENQQFCKYIAEEIKNQKNMIQFQKSLFQHKIDQRFTSQIQTVKNIPENEKQIKFIHFNQQDYYEDEEEFYILEQLIQNQENLPLYRTYRNQKIEKRSKHNQKRFFEKNNWINQDSEQQVI